MIKIVAFTTNSIFISLLFNNILFLFGSLRFRTDNCIDLLSLIHLLNIHRQFLYHPRFSIALVPLLAFVQLSVTWNVRQPLFLLFFTFFSRLNYHYIGNLLFRNAFVWIICINGLFDLSFIFLCIIFGLNLLLFIFYMTDDILITLSVYLDVYWLLLELLL